MIPSQANFAHHNNFLARGYPILRWLCSNKSAGRATQGRNSTKVYGLADADSRRLGQHSFTHTAASNLPGAGKLQLQTPKICILGGGFGGLYTAVRLSTLHWPHGKRPQVTLIDRGDRFVFKPLLYEYVDGTAGLDDVAPRFTKLLGPYNIHFVQGGVKSIEPATGKSNLHSSPSGGRIVLDEGTALEYDWLVLSLGSESTTFGIPGAKEHALAFNSIEDANQVRRALDILKPRTRSQVVVVGSGPAGVELSATVSDYLGAKGLVSLISTGPAVLKGAPVSHRESAESVLQRKGVQISRNCLVTSIKKGPQSKKLVEMKISNGNIQTTEADIVLWTAGSQPNSSKNSSIELPFPLNEKGAMKTDDTLRVVGNPHVFALGDLASAAANTQSMAKVPATAQVAFQQASYAAWNIWAAMHNRPLLPFKYQHLGDMMSLGKDAGAVTLPVTLPIQLYSGLQTWLPASFLQLAGIRIGSPQDPGVTLEGNLGAFIRKVAYLYRQPTDEHRSEVGSRWLQRALQNAKASS